MTESKTNATLVELYNDILHITMKATDIWQIETGRDIPSNQMEYHEWHIEYIKWLEDKLLSMRAKTTDAWKAVQGKAPAPNPSLFNLYNNPKDPNDELWERAKNAAHGEWVAIDPESKVSGFIRYAKDIQDELDTMSKEYAAKTKANEIDRYAIPAMHAILSGRIDFVTTMDVAAKAYSQAEDMIAERNKRTQ